MKEAYPIARLEDPAPPPGGFAPRDVLVAVRRRAWVVAVVFLAVVAFGTWRTWREPHIYRASTTVRVDQGGVPIAGVQAAAPSYDYRVDPLTSEQQVIKSRVVAERVVDLMGLRLRIVRPGISRSSLFGTSIPQVDSAARAAEMTLVLRGRDYLLRSGATAVGPVPYGREIRGFGVALALPQRPAIDEQEVLLEVVPMTAAAADVRRAIATRVVPQTNIVDVSYQGTDPPVVRDVTNELARTYKQVSGEMQRANARDRSRFIEQSARDQERQLVAAQDELKRFKEREQVADIRAEQTAHMTRIQRVEQEMQDARVEQQIYQTLVGRLAEADTLDEDLRKLAGTEAVDKNQYVSRLFTRWNEFLQQREDLFRRGLNSRHDDVRAVDRMITRTKEDLRSASRLYLQALMSRIGSMENTIADLRGQSERYPSLEAQQSRLEANVRTLQTTYDNLQSELQLARIAESVDDGRVMILDEATLPTFAVSPNRKRAVAYSLVIGLLLGIGLAMLLDRLDDSVRSPDELHEQMGLPLLGLIPAIRGERGRKEGNAAAAGRLVTHEDPRSPVAESYRSLRTNLAFARTQQTPQAIVVASPGPADGKSTTAANLAITFAQQGQRTLLVDGDLRRAVLDRTFDTPRSPGLTEVIVGEATLEQGIRETHVPNLWLLPSGTFPPNPAELLGSARMQEVLDAAKQRFDVVLIDSPPLLAVTDGAVLSTRADGTVLVVRTGSTAREAVRRAIGHVRAVRGRLLGAVLNDVDLRSGAYYGGYGHYYYSYYGRDGAEPRGPVRRLRRMVGRAARAGGG